MSCRAAVWVALVCGGLGVVAPATTRAGAPPVTLAQATPKGTDAGKDIRRIKPKRRKKRDGDFVVDEKERKFRVAFPLYDRFYLESNTSMGRGEPQQLTQPALRMGLKLSFALAFTDESIWWKLRHTLVDASVFAHRADGLLGVRGTFLEASYLRHDLSSVILVPSLNDARLPAPFDLAMDYRLGRVDFTWAPKKGFTFTKLELVDLAFLLDFVRDPKYRHRFAIGPAAWYHAEVGEVWKHELTPLTALKVVHSWERKDGLFLARTSATCGNATHFEGGGENVWRWRCRGEMNLEWTPIAINDKPLAIPVELRADVPLEGEEAPSYRATIGVRVSWPL